MTHERYEDFPLRARKRARTRVKLVEALLARLTEHPLDAIPVSALCRDAEISEATFFNYFPTKTDLLTHYVQLWSLEMGRLAHHTRAQTDDPLAALEALFAATAVEISAHPRVMFTIIAHQARETLGEVHDIELVERLLFLDDDPLAPTLSDRGLDALLPAWIGEAVERGSLPQQTPVMELVLAAASIFFGVPLLLGRDQPALIGPMYTRQLQLLWAGARAQYG